MAKEQVNVRSGTPSEATAEVRLKILQLRKQGHTILQISRILGYSEAYIRKQHNKALEKIYVPTAEHVLKMELARLDDMQIEVSKVLAAFHPLVSGGSIVRDVVDDETGLPIINAATGKPVTIRLRDYSPTLAAIDKSLKLMERRAKLLGLDAPTKTAFTNPTGDKEAGFVQFYLPSNGRETPPENPDGEDGKIDGQA